MRKETVRQGWAGADDAVDWDVSRRSVPVVGSEVVETR